MLAGAAAQESAVRARTHESRLTNMPLWQQDRNFRNSLSILPISKSFLSLCPVVCDFEAYPVRVREEDGIIVRCVIGKELGLRALDSILSESLGNSVHHGDGFDPQTKVMKPGSERIVPGTFVSGPEHETEVTIIVLE